MPANYGTEVTNSRENADYADCIFTKCHVLDLVIWYVSHAE